MSSWLKPTTTEVEPIWVSKGDVRGTVELIQTCILTLVLCAWTAIHLDIPAPADRPNNRRKMIKGFLKRVGWTIVAILTPEYILWISIAECWEAVVIRRELRKAQEDRKKEAQEYRKKKDDTTKEKLPSAHTAPKSSSPGLLEAPINGDTLGNHDPPPAKNTDIYVEESQQVPISLVHGFYIEMGGLEIVLKEGQGIEGRKDLQECLGRVTSQGAIALYKAGKIEELPTKQEINDRSKSDVLTKAITCAQAGWMVVQCIGRRASNLPLTLLEINTVMHVMCALIQYGLWFYKPQDVKYPTFIRVDIERLEGFKDIADLQQQSAKPQSNLQENSEPQSNPQENSESTAGNKDPVSRFISGLQSKIKGEPQTFKLTECNGNEKSSKSVELGSSRTADFHYAVLTGAGLGLMTSSVYGAVHLTKWHDHFPTRLERALWRICGCIVVGMPFFLVVFLLSIYAVRSTARGRIMKKEWSESQQSSPEAAGSRQYIQHVNPKTSQFQSFFKVHTEFLKDLRRYRKWAWMFWYSVFVVLQSLACVCYIIARTFLVVEAFGSLRSLPKGAYTSINWISLLPHI